MSNVSSSFSALRRASLVSALVWSGAVFPATEVRAEFVAVASRSFNGYTRTRLPDKSFKQETYAFANGGRLNSPLAGDSIDQMPFRDIARTIAAPLAERGYVPTPSTGETDLLIFVFWGTTYSTGNSSPSRLRENVSDALSQIAISPEVVRDPSGIVSGATAVANAQRDELESSLVQLSVAERFQSNMDADNAGILGFQYDLERAYQIDFTGAARALFDELRTNRYYVVLKAYDFRLAWKEKRRKVLWETRFSIRQEGNDFGEQLMAMTQQASRYFGQSTKGLVRDRLPEVRVDLGEAKVMENERSN